MDKYVFIVLLLAPGFLACLVSVQFDNRNTPNNKFDILMRYFIYSSFILFFSLLFSIFLGFIPLDMDLSDIPKLLVKTFTIKLFIEWLTLVFIISIIIGSMWPTILRSIIKMFNFFRKKLGVNTLPVEPYLIREYFEDNEDHFIVVEKQGKIQLIGLYAGVSWLGKGNMELAVHFYPEYVKFLDQFTNRRNEVSLKACIGMYSLLNEDIIIREYDIRVLEELYNSLSAGGF